jgi:archaellum component FlaC
MDDLAPLLKDIDDNMDNTRDSISGTLRAIEEFENRMNNITQARNELVNMSPQILDPQEQQIVLNRINNLSNRINEVRAELDELDVLLYQSINKIKELQKTKEFAKLIGLESFQSRNLEVVNKALSRPEIFSNIAAYIPKKGGSGSKKKKNRKNRKNRKTRKQNR